MLVASTLPVITATRKPSWVLFPRASKQSWIIVLDSSHYHDLLREGCFMKSKKTLETYMLWHSSKKNSTTFLPASCGCFIPSCSTYIWNRNERPQGDPTLKSLGLRSRTSLFFFWGGWMFSFPIYHHFWTPKFEQGWTPPWYRTELVELDGFGLTHLQLPNEPITSSFHGQNLGKFVKVVFPFHIFGSGISKREK